MTEAQTPTVSPAHTSALIVPSEHGALQGSLTLLPDSPGIVILVHAALAQNADDGLLARPLHEAGLSTLTLDLIASEEAHFPDVRNNVSLLAKRLLIFLNQLRHRMLSGEMPGQALALYAINDTSPVVVRIASQRDHDIAALVCRGGLIDLAGVVYLRSLESPLLLLHTPSETHHIAGNRRALQEVHCPHELRIVPEQAGQTAGSDGAGSALQASVDWFVRHLTPHREETPLL